VGSEKVYSNRVFIITESVIAKCYCSYIHTEWPVVKFIACRMLVVHGWCCWEL